jgi:formate/nitrite transporter FocA (FNT family)
MPQAFMEKPPGAGAPESDPDVEHPTSRSHEREVEAEQYHPVIIKRVDERQRHPDDTLEHAISAGEEQCNRASASLLLSAIAAGLILGFTAMAVAIVGTYTGGDGAGTDTLIHRLGQALVYPLGFVIVIISGTELFTEHTATAVYPVLDRRAKLWKMLRLWGVVLVGNLIGASASAGLLVLCEPVISATPGYTELAGKLITYDVVPLLVSSVLAGWMMGMSAWLVLATTADVSQIFAVYIVTFLIGLGGLHHSIAGAVEAFVGIMMVPGFGMADVAYFLAIAVPGNLIGGAVFVAALNYAHIRKSRMGPKEES